jgi:hypothetical protein
MISKSSWTSFIRRLEKVAEEIQHDRPVIQAAFPKPGGKTG